MLIQKLIHPCKPVKKTQKAVVQCRDFSEKNNGRPKQKQC